MVKSVDISIEKIEVDTKIQRIIVDYTIILETESFMGRVGGGSSQIADLDLQDQIVSFEEAVKASILKNLGLTNEKLTNKTKQEEDPL